MTPTARLGVLLSGSGRTLANLVEAIRQGRLRAEVAVVIASRECLGAERARAAGIRTVVAPGELPPERLAGLLDEHRADLGVCAGYLKYVHVPRAYEGRIVNIHPSLLPAFGGKGMYGERVHAAVLASGAKESGCTVHLVDEQFDHGRIVLQRRCPVLVGDTPESLAERVFALECEAYPVALEELTREGA